MTHIERKQLEELFQNASSDFAEEYDAFILGILCAHYALAEISATKFSSERSKEINKQLFAKAKIKRLSYF